MILQKVLSNRLVLQTIKKSSLVQPMLFKPTQSNVLKTANSFGFSTSARLGVRQMGRQRNFKQVKANAGSIAIGTGEAVVAGASVLGLGALCYYGLGMSKEVSVMDKALLWPQYVRDRVKDTYLYFGGSLITTGVSAYLISQSPALMRLVTRTGIMSMVVSIAAMVGTSMLCRSIEYQPGFGAKQLTWLLHTGVVGAAIAPLMLLGGPLMVRAAALTAGVAGGISAVAMCAPNEKFLNWGGPLAAGFGVVFLASIGSAFLPPTGAAGITLQSISMYGGLLLFSCLLLYNTQKTVKKAETHPQPSVYYKQRPYDPVNACMSMYMDVVNIFVRIAMMMAGGNRRK